MKKNSPVFFDFCGFSFKFGYVKRYYFFLLLNLGFSFYGYSQISPQAEKALNQGIASYGKDDFEQAISFFTTAIGLDSGYVNAYIYRALSKDALLNFSDAIADFNIAQTLDSIDVFVYFERAQTYINLGNTDAAMRDFEMVISLSPNSLDAAESYLFMAKISQKNGDYESAIGNYNFLMRFRPDDAEVFFFRGEARLLAGDFQAAISDFDTSIDMDGGNEQVFFKRGEARLKAGDKAGACEDFVKAKSKGYEMAAEYLKTDCP
ncbi:MAG: hypothetical protein RLZZ46_1650 [Bacteroidota bacterium]